MGSEGRAGDEGGQELPPAQVCERGTSVVSVLLEKTKTLEFFLLPLSADLILPL